MTVKIPPKYPLLAPFSSSFDAWREAARAPVRWYMDDYRLSIDAFKDENHLQHMYMNAEPGQESFGYASAIIFGIGSIVAACFLPVAVPLAICAGVAGVIAAITCGPFMMLGAVSAVSALTYGPAMGVSAFVKDCLRLKKDGIDMKKHQKTIADAKRRRVNEEVMEKLPQLIDSAKKLEGESLLQLLDEFKRAFPDEYSEIAKRQFDKAKRSGMPVDTDISDTDAKLTVKKLKRC